MSLHLTKMKFYTIAGFVLGIFCAAPPAAQAANDEQIRTAITNARSFLQNSFRSGTGTGIPGLHPVAKSEGQSALAGIAMMEAGIGPDDPTIQAIAKVVREEAITQVLTYQLALDIMFLDKLGEPGDTDLIQSMGIRLLAGQ